MIRLLLCAVSWVVEGGAAVWWFVRLARRAT
jgi:hypothetical protein